MYILYLSVSIYCIYGESKLELLDEKYTNTI